MLYTHFISVQQSIELLSRAKKPLILLGSQATLPPVPVDELRQALEVSENASLTSFKHIVPLCDKTGIQGFGPGLTQDGLYCQSRRLEG